jgi:hypothetical protein
MGAAHNDSLDVGKAARNTASTRYPIHFWFAVPMYEYPLECSTKDRMHTFQSRTPIVPILMDNDSGAEQNAQVLCGICQEYREIAPDVEPLNKVVTADEAVAFEQDKGIIRERIALAIQDAGFFENDGQIAEFAVMFGVPVSEIKKINAGLKAPEGLSGEPDMCAANLHELTFDNIVIKGGRRTCKICYKERDRIATALRRARKTASGAGTTHNGRVHR